MATAVLATLSLGGCATYFGAEVTAYHQPDQSLKGLSFKFAPNEAQRDSLQFQAYAAMLRKELLAHGMIETGSRRNEVKVEFDYGTDGGRPVRYTQPQYGYVYQGSNMVRRERVNGHGQVVTVWESVPIYGYELIGYNTYQRTVYRHEIKLTLAYEQPRQGGLSRIYEGTAVTHSEDGSLNNAVPLLIRALFQDFPGPNGATRQVKVLKDEEASEPAAKDADKAADPASKGAQTGAAGDAAAGAAQEAGPAR